MISYGFKKRVDMTFHAAVTKVTEELGKEGFGVLTSIDMKSKFRDKLGVETGNYVILGACNPPFAYETVQAEPDIGLMLPCNAVIYERDGETWVAIIRPTVAMQPVGNEALADVAATVESKLKRAFDAI